MNYIYKSLGEGNYVFGIYINLKRAFDTVQHQIILHKLHRYGIHRLGFQRFESCLPKRKQFIVINNLQSDTSDLCKYGIPQGSVLGPILFLLFINNTHRPLITIKVFADDTNCSISDKSFNSLEKLEEIKLNKLKKNG